MQVVPWEAVADHLQVKQFAAFTGFKSDFARESANDGGGIWQCIRAILGERVIHRQRLQGVTVADDLVGQVTQVAGVAFGDRGCQTVDHEAGRVIVEDGAACHGGCGVNAGRILVVRDVVGAELREFDREGLVVFEHAVALRAEHQVDTGLTHLKGDRALRQQAAHKVCGTCLVVAQAFHLVAHHGSARQVTGAGQGVQKFGGVRRVILGVGYRRLADGNPGIIIADGDLGRPLCDGAVGDADDAQAEGFVRPEGGVAIDAHLQRLRSGAVRTNLQGHRPLGELPAFKVCPVGGHAAAAFHHIRDDDVLARHPLRCNVKAGVLHAAVAFNQAGLLRNDRDAIVIIDQHTRSQCRVYDDCRVRGVRQRHREALVFFKNPVGRDAHLHGLF